MSCTDSGFTLGKEVNIIGAVTSLFYVADKHPEAINDKINPFKYNEPPDDGY